MGEVTKRLRYRIPMAIDETGESSLARLAWANGFQSTQEFAYITGLRLAPGGRVKDEDIPKLSEWSGMPIAVLRRFDIADGTVVPFGATTVKRFQLRSGQSGFCPHCLADDASEPYLRGPWKWSLLTHCHVHGCELRPFPAKFNIADARDFSTLAVEVSRSEPSKPVEADRYFYERLTLPAESGFLDRFPVYVAAEFCALIGQFHRAVELGALTERIPGGFENRDVRLRGFEIAKHGEEAVREFLSEYVRNTGTRVTAPVRMYSPALHWWEVNKHNDDYLPMMRLFQDHAENNIPMEPGEVFMWPITRRKVHTLATASRDYELSEERILRVVEAKLSPSPVPRFLKRSEVHHWLLEEKSYVTTSEAASALGCTIELVDLLIKSDLLAAVPNKTAEGRVFRLIHKVEIDGFLKCLREKVVMVEASPRLRPLGTNSFRAHCSRADVIELAMLGYLRSIAHPEGAFRIDQLLFDLDEVGEQLIKLKKSSVATDREFDHEMIKLEAARRKLGVTRATIDGLVDNGLIKAALKANDVHHKGRINKWVRTIELDEFADRHCSLGQIASSTSLDQTQILDRLAEHQVDPIFVGHRYRERIYRRSDIEGLKFI